MFLSVIDDEEFVNQVSICVVSKFKPKPILLRRYGHTFASFQVDELSSPEVQTLFIRYLSFLKIEIHHDDAKFFLRHLHGIPAQVIYTINLINSTGVPEAKQYIDDIDEFDEVSAYKVLDYLRDDELCKQILIGLSKFEIISYDLSIRYLARMKKFIDAYKRYSTWDYFIT